MFEARSERAAWSRRRLRWALCLAAALLCGAGAVEASAQTATPRFRLAIVGLTHGHAFIAFRTLMKTTAVEVVAISDPSADLRAQAAGIWPGVKLYEDHRRLLDEVKPHGVWSFVDNHQHVGITKDCAERHISVMFEKPMATTHADAMTIRDIARARGIQVVINSQPPWWPANHTASNLARSGGLGTVWRVHTVSGHGVPGGWPAGSQGSHPPGTGSTAAAPAAAGAPAPPARTAGSQAFWSMLIRFETWVGREKREVPVVTLEPHWADPATYFAHAVRRGQVDEFVSAAFHADVMAILEAAQRSAATGQPVSIVSVTGR